jgi:Flp pilus assembly protein TadG
MAPLPPFSPDRLTRAKALLSRFGHDRAGNFAIMFAILAVPLISAVGIAVDLSRAYRVTSITQYALDSASLAAGRAGQTNTTNTLSAAQTAATNFYNASKPVDVLSSTLSLAADSTNTTFTLTATSWVSTPFLGVLSRMFSTAAPSGAPSSCSSAYSCMKISRTATASIGAGGNGGSNVEVSLMLDVTGSMQGSKLTTLKDAASNLVDTIIWSDQSRYTSRMAIVPFAEGVNVGTYFNAVTNTNTSRSWGWWSFTIDPCVVDRSGTNANKDTAPGSGSWIPTFYDSTGQTWCYPDGNSIVPLTSNKTTLKNSITALTANGGTAGALGTQWAWYMISPSWASIWGTASAPSPYADLTTLNSNGAPKLRKFAVLMTDGDYNMMYGDTASTSTTNTAALAVCTGMKNAGITVYTVGFQLSGSTPKTMLTSCASSSDKFYDASSEASLLAAFRDIALKISSLRLTN